MKTIVLGPPGTGKTWTLLNKVEDYLKNTDPDKLNLSIALPLASLAAFLVNAK